MILSNLLFKNSAFNCISRLLPQQFNFGCKSKEKKNVVKYLNK